MHLVINGENTEINDVETVQDLLLKLGYETDSVAVALEGTFISRSKYAQRQLKDNEELEILMPMQGG